jgi:hypothetical protein
MPAADADTPLTPTLSHKGGGSASVAKGEREPAISWSSAQEEWPKILMLEAAANLEVKHTLA